MDDKHKRLEIIGVVKDFYYGGVNDKVQPVIFFNYHRNWARNQMTNLQIKLSGENIDENLERFELTKAEREIIEGAKSLLTKNFKTDFEIYKAFCTQKLETLLIIACLGKEKEVMAI
jgi:putative ABC transport system permease protein